jgi:hypothetical protein
VTANCHDMPNHFALRTDVTMGLRFGGVHSMTPLNLPGEGHRPMVSIRFRGGVVVDFDPVTATELARRLPAVLAFLPTIPDVSGAAVDLESM